MEWTDARLQPLRARTDPGSDAIIRRVAEGGIIEETNRLLHSIITNQQEVPPGLPDYLYEWMNDACQLPAWVDPARIKGANAFFREDGPSISLFACTCGFLWLYACSNGSRVLHASRRLTEDTGRRVAETAQFLLEVCDKGGLSPKGGGVRMIQKVRLMHSSIRYFLTERGGWDAEVWGEPINQEDMLGTILCLGVQIIDDMSNMGIRMKQRHQEDWWYLWRAVGEMLGVEPDLIPESRSEAQQAMKAIISHQMASSKESQELTAALLDFHAEVVPGKRFDGVIPAIMRKSMGAEIADMLGVPQTKWERMVRKGGFRTLGVLDFISGPMGGLIERLSLHFINGKSRRLLGREPAAFGMSDALRSTFHRKAAKAIAAYEDVWEDGVLDEDEEAMIIELQEQLAMSDTDMKRFATLGAINAAVADERIEPKEIDLIEDLARDAGLTDSQIGRIHIALADGRIDAAEREMLHEMMGLIA